MDTLIWYIFLEKLSFDKNSMEEEQVHDQPIYEFVLNWSKDCRIVQLFQFHPNFPEFYSGKIKIKFE